MAKEQLLHKEYPNISTWIEDATIEIGKECGQGIVARASIDEGGVVWEGTKFKDFV